MKSPVPVRMPRRRHFTDAAPGARLETERRERVGEEHALVDGHTALWMRAERLRRVFQLLFRHRVFFTTKTTPRVGCWISAVSPCRSSSSLPPCGLHGRGRTQGWRKD